MSNIIIEFEDEGKETVFTVNELVNYHNNVVETEIDKMISMCKAKAYCTFKENDNWFEKVLRKIHNRRKNCNDVKIIPTTSRIELLEYIKKNFKIEIEENNEHKNQLKLF